MLSITKEGLEYLQLNGDERSLRRHILYAVSGRKGGYDFSEVVDNIKNNSDEYRYNEIRVFAKYTAELVKEGLIQYDNE